MLLIGHAVVLVEEAVGVSRHKGSLTVVGATRGAMFFSPLSNADGRPNVPGDVG